MVMPPSYTTNERCKRTVIKETTFFSANVEIGGYKGEGKNSFARIRRCEWNVCIIPGI